ncbi:MAG TPA: exo-alpha-sialidase [Acidobacteriaceae bacterium]
MKIFLVLLIAALGLGEAGAQKDAAHLLADPAQLANPASLPLIPSTYSVAFRGKPGESGFNLHSYLYFYQGQFWLMWSSSKEREEAPDQHLLYATSKDGHAWSEAKVLVADPDGAEGPQRWIARGMFEENGHLYALGALIASADYKQQGQGVVWNGLQLVRFVWTGKAWKRDSVFAQNCMNNFPPARVQGRYVMPCRDDHMALKIATGTGNGQWNFFAIDATAPFNKMDEPTLLPLPDGTLELIIRDGSHAGYLLRSLSTDHGSTWTKPVHTNYPDATSKNFAMRLSNGEFVLLNNPNQKKRDPLAISVSQDGWTFEQPRALRAGQQMEDPTKTWTFQYPHAMEHNGSLWVAYSINKRDIEVSETKMSDLKVSGH